MERIHPQDVRYVPLSSLSLWDENYRYGDIPAIVASIREFGFNATLRVWRDEVVIAGNQSLKALQEMRRPGGQPPHGVPVDPITGEWLVRILDVTHLTPAKARAFAIADNRTSQLGRDDVDRLTALLKSVREEDPAALDATGYDDEALQALLLSLQVPDEQFHEVDETAAEGVRRVVCPNCGTEFPV